VAHLPDGDLDAAQVEDYFAEEALFDDGDEVGVCRCINDYFLEEC
jgi:hypothetical protein